MGSYFLSCPACCLLLEPGGACCIITPHQLQLPWQKVGSTYVHFVSVSGFLPKVVQNFNSISGKSVKENQCTFPTTIHPSIILGAFPQKGHGGIGANPNCH